VAERFDAIDYVAMADGESLEPLAAAGAEPSSSVVMLVAARLGATRLIDNAVLGQDNLT
jgi:pantothenate synthetase